MKEREKEGKHDILLSLSFKCILNGNYKYLNPFSNIFYTKLIHSLENFSIWWRNMKQCDEYKKLYCKNLNCIARKEYKKAKEDIVSIIILNNDFNEFRTGLINDCFLHHHLFCEIWNISCLFLFPQEVFDVCKTTEEKSFTE